MFNIDTKVSKEELIKRIPWHKDWSEMGIREKCEFCALNTISILCEGNRDAVIEKFNQQKAIIEERGIDKLILYM